MATISNANDPNRATQNVTQQPSNSGTPTSSGGMSTLQKYLQANQNAGQRIAGMVGADVEKESGNLKTASERELGESSTANKAIGDLTNTTKDYTTQLSQPGAATTQSGKKYDVGSYQSNLSGSQAAKDIAQNNLTAFRNIATGSESSKLQDESKKQAQEAVNQSQKEYDTNKQRQQQLGTFQGRNQLLQQALNTKNQRIGLQNLDTALMSQDKNKTTDTIRQNLQQKTGDIVGRTKVAGTQQTDINNLAKAQAEAETGLNARLGSMQQEYQNELENRRKAVDKAKDDTLARMQQDYADFKKTGNISQALYDALQLGNVQNLNELAFTGGQGGVSQKMTQPGQAKNDIRLFDTLNDIPLAKLLDITKLEQKGASYLDYANANDVANLNALASLMGGTNNVTESKFGANQIGESSLDEKLNQRYQDFINKDLQQRFSGSGSDEQGINRSGLFGSNRVGTAYGQSAATASLNDILYGQGIARNTRGTTSSGGLGNLLNNIANLVGPSQITAPSIDNISRAADSITENAGDLLSPEALMGSATMGVGGQLAASELARQQRIAQEQQLRDAGYTFAGRGSINYNDGEQGAAMTRAEQQAIDQVNEQANNYLNNIGYNNLLKLISGGDAY